MKQHSEFKLFIPPAGLVRPLPADEVQKMENHPSRFRYHVYDLDICRLYRQMDDLRTTYNNFSGQPYLKYLGQIREGVIYTLQSFNVDPEFYMNHFYFPLKPGNPAYLPYLGLFLALSDALKIIPILEHHLVEVQENNNLSSDDWFGDLEYTACNFIRSNRFPPEDYFVKHDKIINWIYAKKDVQRYEAFYNEKLDILISAINKFTPKPIAKEIIKKKKPYSQKFAQVVRVKPERVDSLFNDIKKYFGEEEDTLEVLHQILSGKAEPEIMIIFKGPAKSFVDVFRIYFEVGFMEAPSKQAVIKMLCSHFMFFDYRHQNAVPLEPSSVELFMYYGSWPAEKNRIPLSDLPKPQSSYYSSKKMPIKKGVKNSIF